MRALLLPINLALLTLVLVLAGLLLQARLGPARWAAAEAQRLERLGPALDAALRADLLTTPLPQQPAGWPEGAASRALTPWTGVDNALGSEARCVYLGAPVPREGGPPLVLALSWCNLDDDDCHLYTSRFSDPLGGPDVGVPLDHSERHDSPCR